MLPYNTELKAFSRDLRRNMTDAERRLWAKVRGKQIKGRQFYRQRVVGDYIEDFYCPRARLIIEVDGGQHYSAEMADADLRRDDFLRSHHLKVLRFSDHDVLRNLDGVVQTIEEYL